MPCDDISGDGTLSRPGQATPTEQLLPPCPIRPSLSIRSRRSQSTQMSVGDRSLQQSLTWSRSSMSRNRPRHLACRTPFGIPHHRPSSPRCRAAQTPLAVWMTCPWTVSTGTLQVSKHFSSRSEARTYPVPNSARTRTILEGRGWIGSRHLQRVWTHIGRRLPFLCLWLLSPRLLASYSQRKGKESAVPPIPVALGPAALGHCLQTRAVTCRWAEISITSVAEPARSFEVKF
jgi:hypothetical protein